MEVTYECAREYKPDENQRQAALLGTATPSNSRNVSTDSTYMSTSACDELSADEMKREEDQGNERNRRENLRIYSE